jgi:hypothetical protein
MHKLSRSSALILMVLVLLALYPTAALAMPEPPDPEELALGGLVFLAIYLLPIVTLEAGVLNAVLRIGYWRSWRLSPVANVVSTLVGAVCAVVWTAPGWKLALYS